LNFCPDWVFELAAAKTAQIFLTRDIPIEMASQAFANTLNDAYSSVNAEELASVASEMLFFLNDLNAGEESSNILSGFMFFRLNFENLGKPRKKKGLLSAATDGQKKKEYNAESAQRRFRAYIYGLRNDAAPRAPAGWSLSDELDLPILANLDQSEINPLDYF
jgi:hypothetical protein